MTKYERILFTYNIPRFQPTSNEYVMVPYKTCFMGQPNIDYYMFGSRQIAETELFRILESFGAEDILLFNWDGTEIPAGSAGSVLNWVFKED